MGIYDRAYYRDYCQHVAPHQHAGRLLARLLLKSPLSGLVGAAMGILAGGFLALLSLCLIAAGTLAEWTTVGDFALALDRTRFPMLPLQVTAFSLCGTALAGAVGGLFGIAFGSQSFGEKLGGWLAIFPPIVNAILMTVTFLHLTGSDAALPWPRNLIVGMLVFGLLAFLVYMLARIAWRAGCFAAGWGCAIWTGLYPPLKYLFRRQKGTA